MMKSLVVLLFLLSIGIIRCQSRICFTFDDLPIAENERMDSTEKVIVFNKLLRAIRENRIPAIGFVNEYKISENGVPKAYLTEMLQRWADAGLELGNHSYSHFDYNTVPFTTYTEDILKGEQAVRQIAAANNRSVTYFRHPYLHVGNTKERADSLEAFLSAHHYITAPVTIDNDDYLFSAAYLEAKQENRPEEMARIGKDYLVYMEQKVRYFEMQSNRLFNRNIAHVLLLHANAINADYLDSLAEMLKRLHYEFIPIDEALKDPAYQTEITRFGNWGISWIDKWALSMGKKGDFFRDEPSVPKYLE